GRLGTCSATAASTASASACAGVISSEQASGSCSACASRSAATHSGLAESSATTRHSVGPGSASMPTWPKTMRLASTTNRLPGPTILSTRGTVSVPYASAAMACAPPTRYTASTLATAAAASSTSATSPLAAEGGEANNTSGT